MRVVQHRIEVQLVDFRDSTDVARDRLRDLRRVLAHELEEMRDLDGLARISDEQLAARAHRSLVHAQHSELADVRIDADLEHVCDYVFVRIRGNLKLLSLLYIAYQL